MPITNDILVQKIAGSLKPFRDAKPKDLMVRASLEFVDDYRNTRKLFLELHPGYEQIAPPEVVVKDEGNQILTSIGEIAGYYAQLSNFLHDLIGVQHGPITLD